MLESYRSISARLHAGINMLGRQLVGQGVYYEEDPRRVRRMRFELTTPLGNQTATLLHIADGRYLWMYQLLGSDSQLVRYDIDRIAHSIDQAADNPALDRAGWYPNLGGLTRLLRRLAGAVTFEPPAVDQIQQTRVWKLQGVWNTATLAALLPDQKAAFEQGRPFDLSRLPPHVPDRLVLWIGQDDLFVYRVEYWRKAPIASADFPRLPSTDAPLVYLQFYEVAVNGTIDPAHFVYQPGNIAPTDLTEVYLQYRGLLKN